MGEGKEEKPEQAHGTSTNGESNEPKEEEAHYDAVTRIQNEVANLSSMYYNFTGGLQEMAPPVSVTTESVKVESDTSVEYDAQELAAQIVNAHKKIDDLIDGLEDFHEDEEEHIKAIIDLQGKHRRMKEDYEEQMRDNGQIFDVLQDTFAMLAEHQLRHGKFGS